MGRAYEFYKENHPDQFSDSEIIHTSKLDRNFFEYFLNTITNRSEEKKFEIFCRRIAEKEICPNLLPQTGPTGGGDSKVDSETYPVSDQLPIVWYSGIGVEATQERWAFAFSAKKRWEPKLYSDVKSIVDVNNEQKREYKKIFFISNQFISDKNRSKAEDDLRKTYGLDIRVFDRTWLVERVFTKGHTNIAAECFDMSDSFVDSVKQGPGDYSKEYRLKEIENALMNYDPMLPKASMIPIALEAAYKSRSLEQTKEITIAKFERAQKIIKEFGLPNHMTECIYEWAWTLHWWYEDHSGLYSKYCEFEILALSSGNIFELERLSNLWMILRGLILNEKLNIDIKPHTIKLIDALNDFISDHTKPNAAFEATAIKLNISGLLEDDINNVDFDEIVLRYKELINNSDMHLDFSLPKLAKMILRIPFLEDCEGYEELFELLSTKLAERKQEIAKADLFIDRAIKIVDKKPISSISYLGRALIDIYKEESKGRLIVTLFLLAYCFGKIGCYWAARNYYLHVFTLCLTQYTKYGEIHPAIVLSSTKLKMIEVQLGRIGYALSIHEWATIAENLLCIEGREDHKEKKPEDIFDLVMAIAIMKTPFDELKRIPSVVKPFLYHDLPLSAIAAKYMLGYYDEEWLNQCDNDPAIFDQYMNRLYSQLVNQQILYQPWYGTEDKVIMQTKVLGCTICINASNKFVCLELGATILAVIESFFSTGTVRQILIQSPSISIKLNYVQYKSFFIKVEEKTDSSFDIS